MEIHYEDLILERWKQSGAKTKPKPKSDHRVFQSVVAGFRKKLCQRLELPADVKEIMRKPADENNWTNIEALRRAVVDNLQGLSHVELETAALA